MSEELGKVKGQLREDPGECSDCGMEHDLRVKTTTGCKVCEICMLDLPKADDIEKQPDQDEESSEEESTELVKTEDEDTTSDDHAPLVRDSGTPGQNGQKETDPENINLDEDAHDEDIGLIGECVKFIRENPGYQIGEIVDATDPDYKSKDTARNVLKRRLEKEDRVGRIKVSNSYRFYPEGHEKLEEEPDPQPQTTIENLEAVLEERSGDLFAEVVEDIDHHYSSKESAIRRLAGYTKKDRVENAVLTEADQGVRRIYYEDDYDPEEIEESKTEEFKDRIEQKVHEDGEVRKADLVKLLDHHYENDKSAISAIDRFLENEDIDVYREKRGRDDWLISPARYEDVYQNNSEDEEESPMDDGNGSGDDRSNIEILKDRVEQKVHEEGKVWVKDLYEQIEHHYKDSTSARASFRNQYDEMDVVEVEERGKVYLLSPEKYEEEYEEQENDQDEDSNGTGSDSMDEESESTEEQSEPSENGEVAEGLAEEIRTAILESDVDLDGGLMTVLRDWKKGTLDREQVLKLVQGYNENGNIWEHVEVNV